MKTSIGDRYGRWVVVSCEGAGKWGARCDCGTARTVAGDHLRRGASKSCGCLHRERAGAAQRKHGMSKQHLPEYQVWKGMKQRCENPRNPAFARYGGRGITVSPAWSASFSDFLRDMGPRPSDTHSIERVDNDRGYESGNCVWATRTVQNRNQRRNRMVSVEGVTMSAADWEDAAGLQRKRVRHRLDLGWSPEDAVSRPASPRSKLSAEQRADIRRDHAAGASMSALGRKHGVHNTTIRDVVLGNSWRNDAESAIGAFSLSSDAVWVAPEVVQ